MKKDRARTSRFLMNSHGNRRHWGYWICRGLFQGIVGKERSRNTLPINTWAPIVLPEWVNPVSYLGGHEIKSLPGDWLCRLRFYMVFFSPAREVQRFCVKLGRNHFLPHPFQFIVYLLPCDSSMFKSRNSAVGIATGYGLDNRGVGIRVPVGLRIFTLHLVQTGSGVQPTSYLMGSWGSFPGGKSSRGVSWPLTCN
jgi:hypothetical protein